MPRNISEAIKKKKTKNTNNKSINDYNCDVCQDTSRSYWVDGIYGECLMCKNIK